MVVACEAENDKIFRTCYNEPKFPITSIFALFQLRSTNKVNVFTDANLYLIFSLL